jgi:hypothetical protein
VVAAAVAAARAGAGSSAPLDSRELALAVRDVCRAVLAEAFEEAQVAGLCDEGAWEAALGALSSLGADELMVRVEKRAEERARGARPAPPSAPRS